MDLNSPNYAEPDVLYFKSPGNSVAGIDAGQWVEVGSDDWSQSLPMAEAAVFSPASLNRTPKISPLTGFDVKTLSIGLINIEFADPSGYTTLKQIADVINLAQSDVRVVVNKNKLVFYTDMGMNIAISGNACAVLGIDVGTYQAPKLAIAPLTNSPEFEAGLLPKQYNGARTGSVWIRTTEPNGGAKLALKKYNSLSKIFDKVEAPLYPNGSTAIYALDKSGGGANIPEGTVYCQTNSGETFYKDVTQPTSANFKLFRKSKQGANSIISKRITIGWCSKDSTRHSLVFREGLIGTAE
jgi:hypothetical protein